ncbi:MAG: biotin--acetyl-CoA-carboxylase ligase [Dehalococcoidia bacterium]|nr:biotin--acetyl-CoA-carboxylase ligase [Dehalococcoidia bacterium]
MGELSERVIQEGLRTRFLGRVIHAYATISSTMDAARDLALAGAPEGAVVVTDEQTTGRGRLDRHWLSPSGSSVLISALLKPTAAVASRLTMVASLAVAQSIEDSLGLSTTIKWPNDVLIKGKKVSGILVESEVRGEEVAFSIVGIGVNVNFDPAFLTDVIYPATTLSAELGRTVPLCPLIQEILNRLEELYIRVGEGWPIHREWQRRLETVGKRVRVVSFDRVEDGYAESVNEDGSLVLRRTDGTVTTILAGDVTLREQNPA